MATPIDPDARFRRLKEQAKREGSSQIKQAEGALARRFAAQGLTGSGAQIKAEQQVRNEAQGAIGRRLGEIENLQESEALRRQEVEEGRKYQTSEREAGQKFASGQQSLQNKFQMGLLGKQQQFSAQQNELARQLQRKAMALQESQFGQQMDLAMRQFALDEEVTRANMDLAKSEANKKGLFERLGSMSTGDLFKGGGASTGAILGGIIGGVPGAVGGAIGGASISEAKKRLGF